jgi:ribokinase
MGGAIALLGSFTAYNRNPGCSVQVPALTAALVVEATGAVEAIKGVTVASAEGIDPIEAVHFGCATPAISVARGGGAPSILSTLSGIDELLANTAWLGCQGERGPAQ